MRVSSQGPVWQPTYPTSKLRTYICTLVSDNDGIFADIWSRSVADRHVLYAEYGNDYTQYVTARWHDGDWDTYDALDGRGEVVVAMLRKWLDAHPEVTMRVRLTS